MFRLLVSILMIINLQQSLAVNEDRVRGTVKWFNNQKGYGFILNDEEVHFYAHANEIGTYDKTNDYFDDEVANQIDVMNHLQGGDCVTFIPTYEYDRLGRLYGRALEIAKCDLFN